MGKRFKDLGLTALKGQLEQLDPVKNAEKIAKFQKRINDLETGKVKVGDPLTTQVAVPNPEKKKAPTDLNRKQRREPKTKEYEKKQENKVNNQFIQDEINQRLIDRKDANQLFIKGYDSDNAIIKQRFFEKTQELQDLISGLPPVNQGFGLIEEYVIPLRKRIDIEFNQTLKSYREGGQSILKAIEDKKAEEKEVIMKRSEKTFGSAIERRKQFKYEARETFNQPNADKFGLKDDGKPRSRKEFAHRFRGKTETEVSEMLDKEVRDRTPEQRGAFVGRASRELEGQDITNEGVSVGDRRIGAGEFIASQLAKKDIEQIEPKAKGFVGSEFTPDNMRRMGAMTKEETERGEGLLGIRQRREQQYQKEWSADGTTLRNYGFGVLDQEKIRDVATRNDVMLNAVAESIQLLTQGKEPIIEEDEFDEIYQSTKKTREDLQNRRFGGIKPLSREDVKENLEQIQTKFVSSDAYTQAQNNYALQNRFVDVFEKEPNTLQYLQSMKDANGDDFVSGVGNRSVNFVDKDLTMYKQNSSFNPYLDRFNILISYGREPLQFLLNTANNSILKFESDKPIAQEGIYNGVGNIAVMNEVMMGGRVAFIGHTLGGADPNVVSGAKQQGSALGYSMGFINVFNNPFIPEENNIQPMIEQNQIVDMTTPRTDIYNIATRDTSQGKSDLTGGDITLEESHRTSIIDYNTGNVRGEKVFVEEIEQRGVNMSQPYLEQIRKGTYLPTTRAYDTTNQRTRDKLRKAQLTANSFPTVAMGKRKIFGFQMFN